MFERIRVHPIRGALEMHRARANARVGRAAHGLVLNKCTRRTDC